MYRNNIVLIILSTVALFVFAEENMTCVDCSFSDLLVSGDRVLLSMTNKNRCNIYISYDGTDWRSKKVALDYKGDPPNKLLFYRDKYLSISSNGGSLESSDGLSWHSADFDFKLSANDVIVDFSTVGKYLVLSTTIGIYVYSDATGWKRVYGSSDRLGVQLLSKYPQNGVLYAKHGDDILATTDGLSWSLQRNIEGVANIYWDGAAYIALGYHIYRSNDGYKWNRLKINLQLKQEEFLFDIVKGDDKYVAISSLGRVFYSDSGLKWIESAAMPQLVFNHLKVHGSIYLVTGEEKRADGVTSWSTGDYGSTILYSHNGINWRIVTSPSMVCDN